jgi:lipopolysaccharide biosynthesis regulator YciM
MATAKRARKARKTSLRKVARRIEAELPATLDEFSKRVRVRLTRLERAVERAGARYRREIVRALRQASHQLGRFEAEGERRWKRLTTQARRDALLVLRRLEKALEGGKAQGRPATRRKPTSRAGTSTARIGA